MKNNPALQTNEIVSRSYPSVDNLRSVRVDKNVQEAR